MSDANKIIREREYYRLGRLFLDGADAKWIATNEQMSVADAQAAWEYCREKLSAYFAAAAGEERKLLTDTELCSRCEDCLRLLLHWHETISRNERWARAIDNADPAAARFDSELFPAGL